MIFLFVILVTCLLKGNPEVVFNDLNPKTKEKSNVKWTNPDGKVINMGYSGFFKVKSTMGKDNMIFGLFQPCRKKDCSKKPLLLWLQGGPGGPGTFGAFAELGNFWIHVDRSKKDPQEKFFVKERAYSWCEDYNCLFVDQPVGTGFSYQVMNEHDKYDTVEYTKTSKEAMSQIHDVLEVFFRVWPELRKNHFLIGTESYGGIYGPNMAMTIIERNQLKKDPNTHIRLKGLIVGDPTINNALQFATYADTLKGMGVVDDKQKWIVSQVFEEGVKYSGKDCFQSFTRFNSVYMDDSGGGGAGLYKRFTGSSMTENVVLTSSPAEFDYHNDWFNKDTGPKGVTEAFHIDPTRTYSTDEGGLVYSTMVDSGDFCENTEAMYAQLFVLHKLNVMIFSSNLDPLLGPPTTEIAIQAMWNYSAENLKLQGGEMLRKRYYQTEKKIWDVGTEYDSGKKDKEGKPIIIRDEHLAGYYTCVVRYQEQVKEIEGTMCHEDDPNPRFCYVVVRNAGHTTPSYQPRAAWDMFDRFARNLPFENENLCSREREDIRRKVDVGTAIDQRHPPECSGVPPFSGRSIPYCAMWMGE